MSTLSGEQKAELMKTITNDPRFSRIQFRGKNEAGHRMVVRIEGGVLDVIDRDLQDATVISFKVDSIDESPAVARYMAWRKQRDWDGALALTAVAICLGYIVGSTLGWW